MPSREEVVGLQMRLERLKELVSEMEEIVAPIGLFNEQDMAKKKKNEVIEVPVERYSNTEDIPIVTKDRDLTQEEIVEIYEQAQANKDAFEASQTEAPIDRPPAKKGILKCKCACGRVANISDEIVEDGLSWSMIIGNDHFLTLHCEECGSTLTMFIDELPEEGNEE